MYIVYIVFRSEIIQKKLYCTDRRKEIITIVIEAKKIQDILFDVPATS